MARINLYGNTQRAVEVMKYLYEQRDDVSIITSLEQQGEPAYVKNLRTFPSIAYTPECDVLLAVNWRQWIPEEFCAAAKLGAYCLHDSLLPKFRGCSPVVWAVEEGAKETGVTMFRMEKTVDAGPIIGQRREVIHAGETVRSVWNRLTPLYVDLVHAHLPAILNGTVVEYPQPEETLQYIRKRREWPK